MQALYSIRSERLLMEQLDYNLLFRWFVGLSMDDPVWDHSSFTKNRERLLCSEIVVKLFAHIHKQARQKVLLSDEHFTVDGTLIEAWASQISFQSKNGDRGASGGERVGRDTDIDFRGQKRSNETHLSKTDPQARLNRKARGAEARLTYMGHWLIEIRNGLVVDSALTISSGTAEREAALAMVEKLPGS